MIVRPRKDSEIFNMFEIFMAEFTVSCAPIKVIKIDRKIMGTPYLIGFSNVNIDIVFFSNSMLLTSLEAEFLRLLKM